MIRIAVPMALAFLAGVSVVLQQVLNANLRVALNSAAWSGFMSYGVDATTIGRLDCAPVG